MKTLILGNDGQIGWELERCLARAGAVRGFSYPDIDYSKIDNVVELIRSEGPDVVINAAAYTAVDRAEKEADLARIINGEAPGILAAEAKKLGAVFIHYSTDFVFDGEKGAPYTEQDVPNPLNVYGRTKLAGDEAVLAEGGRTLIFRTSWIYGLRGINFLLTMRRLAEERDELNVVDDQTGCPTWCGSVAEGTVKVLDRISDGNEDYYGLYNMVCGGEVSWYGFAKEILGDSVTVNAISTDGYPTPAIRPAYSALDCSKLKAAFGVELPDWRCALKQCVS